MKVYIVEDSAALRERLARIIASIPDVVVSGFATNAQEAVAQIREQKPDAVVLDIRLSASTGFDVLRVLHTLPGRPRVIVLTNYPYPQYRKKYIEAGADYFFDKSTEIDQVMQVLQSLAEQGPGPGGAGPSYPTT